MVAGEVAVRRKGIQNVIHVMSTGVQAGFEAGCRAAADAAADSGRPGGGRPVAPGLGDA